MNLKNLTLFLFIALFPITGCDDEKMDAERLPSVSTNQVSEITGETAACGGIIDDDAGSTVIERGVCWDINPNPTIEQNRSKDGSGGGFFESIMEDLNSGTEYYVRAYATNEFGTNYGMTLSFSTLVYPAIGPISIFDVTSNTVVVDGIVSEESSAEIIEMGICWGLEEEPTINSSTKKIYEHEFHESIESLEPATEYYLRVYTISDAGVNYGESLSFITEEELEDEQPVIPEIIIYEGDNTANITIYASDLETGVTSVDVTVKFSSIEETMRRLYMTQNIAGAGDEVYELDIEGLDKKGDGSVDLPSEDGNEFTYKIPFPVHSMSEGTVVYSLWTTSGRGDYRDTDKRLVAGPGTITINYGGMNPEVVKVKEYTAKILAAPLSDGSSDSFFSLMDGNVFQINGGGEFAAFWDFGYFYGAAYGASLVSTYNYPSAIIDIETNAGITLEELNHTYFAQSELTIEEFDAIASASELDGISQSSEETVTNLAVGDVLEFVDNYGKKGLIKVLEIEPGYSVGDYIRLDIKVQP
ncbi:hypothetical protein BY457_11392 [Marinilabilia salmonicolor]|jgi:hypothetical protein|uniref:hypothetical protein n=1 Tax=Marinilabilia salmonicolor TaxID=989 RepID=UPI000D069B0C|nr:hypothetical protein [Marinilabilia salmonicolor]PRY97018.1 hypothetical protein BY457_11392 [Marinilabilia salmonicolor]